MSDQREVDDLEQPNEPNATTASPDNGAAAEAADQVEHDIASLLTERADFLDRLMRLQADYENYKKRVGKNQADEINRSTGRFVEDLLPVLDACELAYAHGVTGIEGIWSGLLGALRRHGLEPMDAADKPFDPSQHEAVMHDEGDGGPVVAEVLRTGYTWQGKVLRPAMVKVRG